MPTYGTPSTYSRAANNLFLAACRLVYFGTNLVSSAFATCSSASTTMISIWQGEAMKGLIRPWARYVRRRILGAWLTWMCLIRSDSGFNPFACTLLTLRQMGQGTSAFASAFFNNPNRNLADFSGQRARMRKNRDKLNTSICSKLLALRSSTHTSLESSEGNGLLVLTHIVEVANGLVQAHSVDGLRSFAGVLEMDAKIRAASLCRLCWVDGGCCVADHGASRRWLTTAPTILWCVGDSRCCPSALV